jgi:pyruvate/2-oxoglutarate dehydrogenase complex dihydrolipoamide acyltransferase (E2) component
MESTKIMKYRYYYKTFPPSRIATFDTFSVGLSKHHIAALLEFDVTDSREKLQQLRRSGIPVSFNGWIIKVVSQVLEMHPEACAFLYNKRKLILFHDINISFIIEKTIDHHKVPIPVVIEKANEKSAVDITAEIERAKDQVLSSDERVIQQKTTLPEKLYPHLPGFFRRWIWKKLLQNPKIAYPKMGNVVITAPGMLGRINGWFIHRSVHPLSIGIGSILKKPVAMNNEVKIREILNMTLLVDHDVVDGGPMVRFLRDLTEFIETGAQIPGPNP